MIGQRIGSYRLTRVLGEGGMGVVYEAVHEGIGGRAAIKVLKPEYALQSDVAARFFNEARAANLIEHPGIVKVFDYGQLPQGVAFLAMEFLEGETLYIRLQRERRLSEADTVRIGRQMAAALAAAHAKQVIHRDLKPDNVFIVADAEVDNGERVKLLDFGIAKIAAQKGVLRTGTNMLLGTPIYMSPEQCRGSKSIGDRTDVYSLGVMLYEQRVSVERLGRGVPRAALRIRSARRPGAFMIGACKVPRARCLRSMCSAAFRPTSAAT